MWNHINSNSLTRTLSHEHKVKLKRRMYSTKQHNARKLTPCSYHFFVCILFAYDLAVQEFPVFPLLLREMEKSG